MEYAVKAVENGGTAIGIRCNDGVVLAVEKIITSKLLKPNANKRISMQHSFIVVSISDPTLLTLRLQVLLTATSVLSALAFSPTVDILSPELATKPPHGDRLTKRPSR